MERSPFEWSDAQMREACAALTESLSSWWQALPNLPPKGLPSDKQQRAPSLPSLPEAGQDFGKLLAEIQAQLAGAGEVVGHPGYLAYVAGAANPVAPLAQAFAMLLNPYTGTYVTAPAAVRLEEEALGWIKEMVAWPRSAFAWVTSGSSLAILSAVIAARQSRPAPIGQRRVYFSEQTHHCLAKACFAAGFLTEEIRLIPTQQGRLDLASLEQALWQDQAAGLTGVLLVGNAGTTNSGRVDDLVAMHQLALRFNLWFHIDGAYGGFFRLLPELGCLAGLELGDSLSLDPHKALCMPYGTGILLCKEARYLRWPRGANASYMPELEPDHLRLEYSDISPELSRDFRGLRLWLSLRTFGAEAYRNHLREKYQLAQEFAVWLSQEPRLELLAPPDLSLCAWALRSDADGARTRVLLETINAEGRYFMTSCRFEGRFAIRTCILGFRFHTAELAGLKVSIELGLRSLGL